MISLLVMYVCARIMVDYALGAAGDAAIVKISRVASNVVRVCLPTGIAVGGRVVFTFCLLFVHSHPAGSGEEVTGDIPGKRGRDR